MFDITVDQEELKSLYLEEVKKRLDEIELQTMLMDSKQLKKMLSLSWPTIEKVFLSDPNFPSMRVGNKWVFHRRKVEEYINIWTEMKFEKQGRRDDL